MIKLLKIIGGMAGGVIAALVAIEITLRLVGYGNVIVDYPDPELGTSGRPFARGLQSLEGRVYLELNSLGHHDREHEKVKPPNTYRIVLLGNSFSAAHQVPLKAMMASLLPDELGRCGALNGKTVEVVNFAYDGFDLRHHYILMRDRVFQWNPDLIMVEMQPIYGLSGFLPERVPSTSGPNVDVVDGKVVVNNAFEHSKAHQIKSSRIFRTLLEWSDRIRVLQYVMELQFKLRTPPVQPVRPEEGLGTDWKEARVHALRVLSAVDDLAKAHDVPLVVALATMDMAMNPTKPAHLRADPIAEDLETNIQAMGLPVMGIERELSAYGDRERVYLHGFGGSETGIGHWNREGNRLAAQAYGRRLCSLLTDGTIPHGIAEAPLP